jgi:hypothetical protein
MTDRACIQVYGAGQTGSTLWVRSNRACRIWCSQRIQIAGMRIWNRLSDSAVPDIDASVLVAYTLDLIAGIPGELHLGHGIIDAGPYRNVEMPPANGAILLSGGEAWPGYEPDWWIRLQQLAVVEGVEIGPHGPN